MKINTEFLWLASGIRNAIQSFMPAVVDFVQGKTYLVHVQVYLDSVGLSVTNPTIEERDVCVVDAERLARLEKAELELEYLNAAGVDNWSGYSYAWELAREDGIEL